MPTYRLDLAYDGTAFHGYARQPDVRTVQGELEDALFKHTGPLPTSVAGRTDAGVHARGQVVSFAPPEAADTGRVLRSLRSQVAPDIGVVALRRVAGGFDARFSAAWRRYRYRVRNTGVPDPFDRLYALAVPEPLDVAAMHRAAAHFVGRHDFASLCRASPTGTTVRTVLAAGWRVAGSSLCFDVVARAFCHQMVRSQVALCLEVGRGRLSPADVPAVLAARDRNAARGAAAPHGLTLWEVGYDRTPAP